MIDRRIGEHVLSVLVLATQLKDHEGGLRFKRDGELWLKHRHGKLRLCHDEDGFERGYSLGSQRFCVLAPQWYRFCGRTLSVAEGYCGSRSTK